MLKNALLWARGMLWLRILFSKELLFCGIQKVPASEFLEGNSHNVSNIYQHKQIFLNQLSRCSAFDCEKCIPNKTHPSSSTSPTYPPPHPRTHEIFRGLFCTNWATFNYIVGSLLLGHQVVATSTLTIWSSSISWQPSTSSRNMTTARPWRPEPFWPPWRGELSSYFTQIQVGFSRVPNA